MSDLFQEIVFTGVGVSPGIAIAAPFYFLFTEEHSSEFGVANQTGCQVNRYRAAIKQCQEEFAELKTKTPLSLSDEELGLIESCLLITADPLFTEEVENKIKATNCPAEEALKEVVYAYKECFESIGDSFFKGRFLDVLDVFRRVLWTLKKVSRPSLASLTTDSIVLAEDFSTVDVLEAHQTHTCALISQNGTAISHAAILAKARGIPCVLNIPVLLLRENICDQMVVDGNQGLVILNPSAKTLEKYSKMAALEQQLNKEVRASGRKIETYDGYPIRLCLNIQKAEEGTLSHQLGCDGIGLYRSECEFLSLDYFPSEQEQFSKYRQLIEGANGLPVVIRAFDLGGDKKMSCHPAEEEENPILGCRAVRFLLQRKDVFKQQLRAVLRAGVYGNVKMMFPMIAAVSELRAVKAIVKEVESDLEKEEVAFARGVPLGCMVEVPSAAIVADLLARECDFLSIGTNDLVQYALAVDRRNHLTTELYTPAHPSVLRLIRLIVLEANRVGIPVSVCGEVAADLRFTPLLLGLGIHELSVSSGSVSRLKNRIAGLSIVEAVLLTERVMTLSSEEEINLILEEELQRSWKSYDECQAEKKEPALR